MARSRESVEGSLELLLDTITNTFGSVLFITMLVAILLRMSGRVTGEQEPVSKTAQARAEARVAESSAEIDRLKTALDALPASDPVLTQIESDVTAVVSETARVLAEDAAIAKEMVVDQERVAEIEQRAAEAEKLLSQLEPAAKEQADRRQKAEEKAAELARIAVELDRPVDPDRIVQTATLPELSATKKKQFGLFIKYGRVYVMHVWDANGERLHPNTDDFVIAARPDGTQSAKARPDAGQIADAATIRKSLSEILKRFPADRWVVAVVVNDDSFAQFQTVKTALVDLGYQYEPVIVRRNNGVWDFGGTGKRGQ